MSEKPTVARRLQPAYVLMAQDASLREAVSTATPEAWSLKLVASVEELGDWQTIILHRFVLVDLDERTAFHPLEPIKKIREEYLLNVPIFGIGGDKEVQDAARIAKCDRFFGRDEAVLRLPEYFKQFGWGAGG